MRNGFSITANPLWYKTDHHSNKTMNIKRSLICIYHSVRLLFLRWHLFTECKWRQGKRRKPKKKVNLICWEENMRWHEACWQQLLSSVNAWNFTGTRDRCPGPSAPMPPKNAPVDFHSSYVFLQTEFIKTIGYSCSSQTDSIGVSDSTCNLKCSLCFGLMYRTCQKRAVLAPMAKVSYGPYKMMVCFRCVSNIH